MSGAHAVRILRDGTPAAGRLAGDTVELEDGTRIPEQEASFLAPVEPSKILAVHLTYASRIDEYAARRPAQPSYFLKPPSTLNGHRGSCGVLAARASSTTKASSRSSSAAG